MELSIASLNGIIGGMENGYAMHLQCIIDQLYFEQLREALLIPTRVSHSQVPSAVLMLFQLEVQVAIAELQSLGPMR